MKATEYADPRDAAGLDASGARGGFSLVEVVVSMVILAVIVMSLGAMTVHTAQRSIGLANGTARQAFTLQETNRLAAVPYASLFAQAGCDSVSTGQLSYGRCISITQGSRYREVTIIITPHRTGTYADTVIFRRVTDVTANPIGP